MLQQMHLPEVTPKGLAIAGGVLLVAVGGAYLIVRAARDPLKQSAQPFLIRQNYLKTPGGLAQAVAYRTQNYGYFPGFGDASLNLHPPSYYAVPTTFFGLPVTLNRRIVPALRAVETALRAQCPSYTPQALSGLRLANTYHDNEVSNHVYGIAIDIDPQRNPCCGCVGHWAGDPICTQPDTGPYSRMAMPECWVNVFEQYGFYWLGHDPTLRDTMHFEFLGVPPVVAGGGGDAATLLPPDPSAGWGE